MPSWENLLERNVAWADAVAAGDPDYFQRLVSDHRPRAIFVACSDARVPAEILTGSELGELFMHRNVGNLVVPTDASLGAGLQYAIEVLGVDDVIVCGHHSCGGCRAAVGPEAPGHVEAWISPLRMLARLHAGDLAEVPEADRANRLAALNVVEQIRNLVRHPSVRRARAQGRNLRLHGWFFDMPRGVLVPKVRVDRGGVWHHDAIPAPLVAELAAG